MKNNKITAEEQDTDKHCSERKACKRKWFATLFLSSGRHECALAEDCIDLAHQACKLAAVDIKKKKSRNCTQNKKWGHNRKIY